jgi:hypothetical protein
MHGNRIVDQGGAGRTESVVMWSGGEGSEDHPHDVAEAAKGSCPLCQRARPAVMPASRDLASPFPDPRITCDQQRHPGQLSRHRGCRRTEPSSISLPGSDWPMPTCSARTAVSTPDPAFTPIGHHAISDVGITVTHNVYAPMCAAKSEDRSTGRRRPSRHGTGGGRTRGRWHVTHS